MSLTTKHTFALSHVCLSTKETFALLRSTGKLSQRVLFVLFLLLSQYAFSQNPIAGNQSFQILSEGNFTSTNSHHIHGPLAVGGNLIINTPSIGEINMDNTGSYVFPGDGSVPSGLLVKGSITWTTGALKVNDGNYIHVGNSTGSITSNNGGTGLTQVLPTGTSYNNAKRIEASVIQPTNVFQTVGFDLTTLFNTYRSTSTTLSTKTNNVQLYNSSNGAIAGNTVSSAQNVRINSLNPGVNYLNLTSASLNNITELLFDVAAVPSASKVLVINVPITANFVWNNSNMAGIAGIQGPYVLWNFYGGTTYNLTLNTASMVVGTVFAPNMNLIKTGTGDTEGGLIAKTIQLGTGEIHNFQFASDLSTSDPCTCTGNLLTNNSFENGITGWSSSGGSAYNGTGYQVCGSYNGYLQATTTNAWLWQQVSATVATTYNLSFWGGTHDPNYTHYVRLGFYNSSNTLIGSNQINVDYDVDSNNDLAFYSFSSTAPANTSYMRVEVFANGDYVKLDQMCLSNAATGGSTTCTPPTVTASSNSPVSAGGTINLTSTSTGGSGGQLATNGDFSSGNNSFSSDYTFGGGYNIASNPQTVWSWALNCSNPSGNMIIGDGNGNASSRFWYQSINVTAGTTYTLSFKAYDFWGGTPAAKLQWGVNGTKTGAISNLSTGGCNTWQQISTTWTATTTGTAVFAIYNNEVSAGNNDFAIDDVSIVATAPLTYSWSGPLSFTSTTQNPTLSNATTSMAGVYTLTSNVGGCTATATTNVVVNSGFSCSGSCESANLVVNPQFETDMSGWIASNGQLTRGGGGTYGSFLEVNVGDLTGTYAAYQDVAFGANAPYKFTAYAAKHALNNLPKMYLEFFNGTTFISKTADILVTKNYDGTFQLINFEGNTPANTTKIRIVGWTQNNALKFDNVSLVGCQACFLIVPPASICVGQSATLTANNCSGTVTWNTGATGSTITVNPTTTTTYTATCNNTTNVLSNPSFETGNLTAWSNWNYTTITSTASEKYNGTYGAKVTASSAGGGFAQDNVAAAGESYTMKVWGKVSSATPWSGIGVKFLNSSWAILADVSAEVNATSFQEYTVTNTAAPAGTAWVQVYAWTDPSTILYLDNFSLVKTSANTTATATVTVNTAPTATATGDTECVGSTIILGSTGGVNYSWAGPASFASTLQNPTRVSATTAMAGVYTVTVTSANGCTATATANVTVNNGTIPTATVVNTGCTGATGSITVTNLPDGYSTNINGGAWTQYKNSYVDLAAGTYAIGYQGGGCNTYANFTVATSTDNPLLSLAKTDPTCTTTGSVTVTGSGGTTGLGDATYQLWYGITGGGVSSLTSNANYPNTPSLSTLVGVAEGYNNSMDNFGGRISGYIVAPTTGTYYFWVASDDNSEFWGSGDTNQANKILLASVTGYTGYREWNKYTSQKTAAISLNAGQMYYFEVLHKEGTGGDNISLGWSKPGEATTVPSEVIPGKYLRPNIASSTTTPVYQYKIGGGAFQTGNVFTGLAAGTYTVTIQDAGGCTATSAITLTTTGSLATPTATSGNRCGTGTVTLSASGCAGTYNWYTAATGGTSIGTGATFTTPSISATTTYYVDCTVSSCVSATRAAALATVRTISISNIVVSSCINQPLQDVATVSMFIAWANAPSGDKIKVVINNKTEYIDVAGGATSPQTLTFTVPANGIANNVISASWVTFGGGNCTTLANFNAPVACSSDNLNCEKILYLCGPDKPADGDAWDHGFMNYLNTVGTGTGLAAYTKPDASGYGLYDPSNINNIMSVNLNDYTLVIVSPTTQDAIAANLLTALKGYSGGVLMMNFAQANSLGLTVGNGYYNYQNTGYTNNTNQISIYNYDNINPSYNLVLTGGDYQPVGVGSLWYGLNNASTTNNGINFKYNASDALPGVPATHGKRVYLGFHMNGLYSNAQNSGAMPAPASSYFNPAIHLTLEAKVIFDQAIKNATTGVMVAATGDTECAGETISLTSTGVGINTYAWAGPNSFTSTLQNPTRANATAAMGGIYTITVTSTTGCTATATANVVVNTIAAPTSAGASRCNAGTLTLTATGCAGTYNWYAALTGGASLSTSASYITPNISTTTNYFVSCTVGSCTNITRTTVAATINSTPTSVTATSNSPVTYGNAINLSATATGATTYTWSGPNNFTSNAQNPTIAVSDGTNVGTYTLTAVGIGGCTSTTTTDVFVFSSELGMVDCSVIPTLNFANPSIISGTAGAVGTQYRFSNVLAGTDAIVTIQSKSHTDIDILNIDSPVSAYGGYEAAMQPIIDYNWINGGGSFDTAGDKSVTFKIDFVNAGTTTSKVVPLVTMTGLDIDGSGVANEVREFINASGHQSFEKQSTSTLTISGNTKALGPTTTYSGVNETVLDVMASYFYPNVSSITVTYGANWGGATADFVDLGLPNTDEARLNSLYFKCFNLNEITCNPVTAPTTTGASRCGTGTVTLSASGCTNGTYNWYDALTGGASLGANATFTTPSISATTSYFVDCTLAGCTSSPRVQATATVFTLPTTSSAGTDKTNCNNGTFTMSANVPTVGTGTWTLVSGTATITNATSATTTITGLAAGNSATLRWTISNGTCTSSTDEVILTNNALPTTPTSTGGSRCGTGTISLSASGCAGGTISWYGALTGGTALTTGATYTTPSITATTTYYLECSLNGCISATRNSAIATVNSIPTASATGDTECVGSIVNLASSGGSTYSWTGPSSFASTLQNPPITNAQTINAGIYTVTVTSAAGCSATATANVVVNAIPSSPTSAGASRCGTGTVTMTASGCAGGTISWYGALTGGTALTTGTTYTTPSITSTTTYFLECSLSGCVSTTRNSAVATVNSILTASATGDTECVGSIVNLASSGGSTYSWTGPSSFASTLQNPPITNAQTINAGIYTVTVTSAAGCSATATANVVVNAIPSSPTSAGASRCGTGTVTMTASGCAGGTISWYGALTGGTALTTGTTYTTPSITASTTYYLECSLNTCISSTRNSAVATINGIPTATATGDTECLGATITLSASGGSGTPPFTYLWAGPNSFTSTSATPSIANAQLVHAGTYTVTVTSAASCSATTTASVVVSSIAAPTATGASLCGSGAVALSASGCSGTYNWYTVATGGTSIGADDSYITPIISGSTTYYVDCTVNGCVSPRASATATILSTITAMASSNSPYISGGALNLFGTGTGTYAWAGPNNFSSAQQNPVIANAGTDRVGTYTLTVTAANGCKAVATIYATTTSGTGIDGNGACNDPIVAGTTKINASRTGICLGCSVTAASTVVNGNLGDYAEMTIGASIIGGGVSISVQDTVTDYPSGNYAGFTVQPVGNILSTSILSGITINTYLNGVLQETATSGNGLLKLSILSGYGSLQRVGLQTTKNYDEIQIIANGGLVSLLTGLRVFYAFEEPISCDKKCEQPISTSSFGGTIVSSRSGISGLLCLGSVTNTANVLDADSTNFASMSLAIGALCQSALSVKANTSFSAGTQAGYVVANASGILSLNILSNIRIETYLNGAIRESISANSSVVSIGLFNPTSNLTAISFKSSLSFDEVRIVVAGTVSLLSQLNVYYPFIRRDADGDGIPDCLDKCPNGSDLADSNGDGVPDACTPEFPTVVANGDTVCVGQTIYLTGNATQTELLEDNNVCNDAIVGTGVRLNPSLTGICLGCTVSNGAAVIDGDLSNYTELAIGVSIIGGGTALSVQDTMRRYPAGNYAGFVVQPVGGLLDLSVLSSITIRTFLNGVLQESATIGNSLIGISVLSGNGGLQKVGFVATKTYDEIQIIAGGGLASLLTALRVYYAFEEPSSCWKNCEEAMKVSNFGASIVSSRTGVLGLLCLGSVANSSRLIDSDTTNYATMNLAIGLICQTAVSVKGTATLPAGTHAGFVVANSGGLLSLSMLGNIKIETYLGGSLRESITLNSNLVTVGLLNPSSPLTRLSFKTGQSFDEVRLVVYGTISLLSQLNVYYSFIRRDSDSDGVPNCLDKCVGNDLADADGDGTPDACDVTNTTLLTYSWTGPGGFTSNVQSPTRPNATTAMSGIYTLTITNSSGYVRTLTTNVTVSPYPTISATPSTICVGGTIATSVSGANIYTWSGPGGFTSNEIIITRANATTAMGGIYTIVASNYSVCNSTGTVAITVNTLPAAPAVANAARCDVGAITITATGCTGGTIQWFASQTGTAMLASGTSYNIASLSSSAVYFTSCTDANSCVSTSRSYGVAEINPIPDAGLTGIGSLCLGYQPTNSGKLILTKFKSTDTFSYNIGSSYNSGTASALAAIPANGEVLTGIADPSTSVTYTVRIKNAENCIIDRIVTLTNQCSVCPAGYCEPSVIVKTK